MTSPVFFVAPAASYLRCGTALLLAATLGSAVVTAQNTGSTGSSSATAPGPRADTARATGSNPTAGSLERSDRTFIEKAGKSGMKEQALSELAEQRATNEQVREYAEQLSQDHHKVNQELMQLAQRKGVQLEAAKHHVGAMGSTAASRGTTSGASTSDRTAGATTRSPAGTDRATADASGGSVTPTTAAGSGRAQETQAKQMAQMATMKDEDYQKLAEETGRDFDQHYVKLMVKEHESAVELFEEAAEDAEDPDVRSFASKHVSALREHLQEAKNLQRAVAE